jgi:hypothetical protein
VFLAAGVVQIFLAGVGVFGLDGASLADATSFGPHRTWGFVMSGVALAVLVLAVVARAGVQAIVLAAVILLLTAVGQSLLAALGENSPLVGGLHALDGLVILGLAGFLFGSSRRADVHGR